MKVPDLRPAAVDAWCRRWLGAGAGEVLFTTGHRVGLAAAVWPSGAEPRAASVAESEAFIESYQHAARRPWRAHEIQASWAAGLWVYAFNAKKASLDGGSWLEPGEAAERLRRAGA